MYDCDIKLVTILGIIIYSTVTDRCPITELKNIVQRTTTQYFVVFIRYLFLFPINCFYYKSE